MGFATSALGFVVSMLGCASLAPGFDKAALSSSNVLDCAAPGFVENVLSPCAGLGSVVLELGLAVSALGSAVSSPGSTPRVLGFGAGGGRLNGKIAFRKPPKKPSKSRLKTVISSDFGSRWLQEPFRDLWRSWTRLGSALSGPGVELSIPGFALSQPGFEAFWALPKPSEEALLYLCARPCR